MRPSRDELPASEFRVVEGASAEADIGEATEMLDHTEGSPCVLFDAIPGFDRLPPSSSIQM